MRFIIYVTKNKYYMEKVEYNGLWFDEGTDDFAPSAATVTVTVSPAGSPPGIRPLPDRVDLLGTLNVLIPIEVDGAGVVTVDGLPPGAVYLEDEGESEVYQVVTTMRQNALKGLISKESPMGKGLLGRRVGERFQVTSDGGYCYWAQVKAIEKGAEAHAYSAPAKTPQAEEDEAPQIEASAAESSAPIED